MKKVKLCLVDDHIMLRSGLAQLLSRMDFEIIFEATNGRDFMDGLLKNGIPDLVLMDLNMPIMDGFTTTLQLRKHYPLVKVLALSMYDNEYSIIRMLKCGASGFVVKDGSPEELKTAIENVINKGFHYSDQVTGKVLHSILKNSENEETAIINLNDREITFLKLTASELTYQQIATEMHVSPRTVDGYRDQLFEKLNVKSRIGLALYAIRHNIVHVH
jgi:DNA-binding NarL/FixJ family response regulator